MKDGISFNVYITKSSHAGVQVRLGIGTKIFGEPRIYYQFGITAAAVNEVTQHLLTVIVMFAVAKRLGAAIMVEVTVNEYSQAVVPKSGLTVIVDPFNTTKAFEGEILKEYEPHQLGP